MSVLPAEALSHAQQRLEQAKYQLKQVIVGHDHLLERLLLAVICRGHVLLEGAPGLAKTLTLRTLAQIIDVSFKRIQFTPDLLPSDLIGTRVYNPTDSSFSVEKGPIFGNFILADEINRAPAKVQSALLEAMQERQVTIGKETFELSAPFMVMATQNPIEQEGTYPLPEAQMDRFLFKLLVDYPNDTEEMAILERYTRSQTPTPEAILTPEDINKLAGWAEEVYLDPNHAQQIVSLVQATRREYAQYIAFGGSPRATLAIAKSCKGLALLQGRDYVLPDDILAVAKDCLRHRILLTYEAIAKGVNADQILDEALLKLSFKCDEPGKAAPEVVTS